MVKPSELSPWQAHLITRAIHDADLPPGVAEYVALVKAFDRERGNRASEPRFYPGSPWIARRLARPQDRLALFYNPLVTDWNDFREQQVADYIQGFSSW